MIKLNLKKLLEENGIAGKNFEKKLYETLKGVK